MGESAEIQVMAGKITTPSRDVTIIGRTWQAWRTEEKGASCRGQHRQRKLWARRSRVFITSVKLETAILVPASATRTPATSALVTYHEQGNGLVVGTVNKWTHQG